MPSQETSNIEQALLAGCIKDRDIFYRTYGPILEEDLESSDNKLIYRDLIELRNSKGSADLPSLIDYMSDKKDLSKIKGGKSYIEDLVISYEPTIDEVNIYIQQIKDKALMRNFLDTLHNIEANYQTKSITDVSSFIAKAEADILKITSNRRVSEFRDPKDVFKSLTGKFQEDFKFRQENKIKDFYITGYPTGYEDLDKLTGGFQPSKLMILAARPGVGKTALALNFAHRMAKMGRTVGIFSMEMTAEEVLLRILSMESKLTSNEISRLLVSNDENSYYDSEKMNLDRQSLQEAINTINQEKIFFDDSSGLNLNDIIAKTRKLKSRYNDLSLIVIDYLGLINYSNEKNSNVTYQIGLITKGLKAMAKNFNVPVLLLCQLSRGIEFRPNHKPAIADLRDSGNIEQDADMIFFIYRPDYYSNQDAADTGKKGQFKQEEQVNPNTNPDISNTSLILAKNRGGKPGEINFAFYKKYQRFEAVISDDSFEESN